MVSASFIGYLVAFLLPTALLHYWVFSDSFFQAAADSKAMYQPHSVQISVEDQSRWVNQKILTINSTDRLESKEHSTNEVLVASDVEKLKEYKHSFAYDRKTWEQKKPRIAILAGPHKTASTTLQTFFSSVAGSTVRLTNRTIESSHTHEPHSSVTDWVWPLGVSEEYDEESSLGGGFKTMKPAKFYSVLASLISGRRRVVFFSNKSEKSLDKAREYHRALFRRPWEEEKNIIIAAEAFDTLVEGLVDEKNDGRGEDIHVSSTSSEMIDALLDVFPWGETNYTSPLRLDDIEVQINYRTPKISHVRSIWHQLGKRTTLRQFLYNDNFRHHLYQLNSLALALQFVRRGIKTSILDMRGASENSVPENGTDSNVGIGGLQGIVACEVLRMGEENGLCDDQSRLHLPGYKSSLKDMNQKADKNVVNLTPDQLDEISSLLEEYDCSVWQHLQKYQAQGLLRILHPSEDLFGKCEPNSTTDISFISTMRKVKEVAGQEDNGIPQQTKEEQDKMWEERAKNKAQPASAMPNL